MRIKQRDFNKHMKLRFPTVTAQTVGLIKRTAISCWNL